MCKQTLSEERAEGKVLIIGGDHHNSLALARWYSINGVEGECYIISTEENFLFKNQSTIKQPIFLMLKMLPWILY